MDRSAAASTTPWAEKRPSPPERQVVSPSKALDRITPRPSPPAPSNLAEKRMVDPAGPVSPTVDESSSPSNSAFWVAALLAGKSELYFIVPR